MSENIPGTPMEPDEMYDTIPVSYDPYTEQSMITQATLIINEIPERRKSMDKTRPTTPIIDTNDLNNLNSTIDCLNNYKEKLNSSRPSFSNEEENDCGDRRPSKQDKEVQFSLKNVV